MHKGEFLNFAQKAKSSKKMLSLTTSTRSLFIVTFPKMNNYYKVLFFSLFSIGKKYAYLLLEWFPQQ